ANDNQVGFWGNTGVGWGLVMDTSDGNVGIGTPTPSRKLHVEPSEIHSGGGGGGFSFANREGLGFVELPGAGERWVWYASGGTARLWSGADKLSVTPSGDVTVQGFTLFHRGADLVISGRTGGNPRALVDGGSKLIVNFANDYAQGVEVQSNLSIGGNRTYLLGLDGAALHWIMA